MARAGSIVLISCYELGHQPLGVASAVGFLERAGYTPDVVDIAVEPFDAAKVARARFIGISVPMHTALRLGVRLAERIRAVNAECHICLFGLYAILNADYLLEHVADTVIGGEFEDA
ncbi:MAG: cobalamin-dependent protein, partial [Candidatus Methylomirabilaceae bacterium]